MCSVANYGRRDGIIIGKHRDVESKESKKEEQKGDRKKDITRATVDKNAKPQKEVNRERKIYEKKWGGERRMKGEGQERGLCNLY